MRNHFFLFLAAAAAINQRDFQLLIFDSLTRWHFDRHFSEPLLSFIPIIKKAIRVLYLLHTVLRGGQCHQTLRCVYAPYQNLPLTSFMRITMIMNETRGPFYSPKFVPFFERPRDHGQMSRIGDDSCNGTAASSIINTRSVLFNIFAFITLADGMSKTLGSV